MIAFLHTPTVKTLQRSIRRSVDSDAHILREDNAAFLPGGAAPLAISYCSLGPS